MNVKETIEHFKKFYISYGPYKDDIVKSMVYGMTSEIRDMDEIVDALRNVGSDNLADKIDNILIKMTARYFLLYGEIFKEDVE